MSAPPYRVLVLPGGTEIGLEIRRALADLKEVLLFGAGSAADQHGPFAYKRWSEVPSVDEPGWLEALNAVLRTHAIDFVFPAHDEVLVELSEHREELAAGLVASPADTNRVARSKRRTYELLADVVDVPAVYDSVDHVRAYPVFVKPDRGQGSAGAKLVRDATELQRAIADGSDLVMEPLPGAELTVDCFTDRRRGLLFAHGRSRESVRSGISTASSVAGDQAELRNIAERIGSRLELTGAWFFQLREDARGRPRLLEVGPRMAGTMALHRVLGVNFALLSLYEQAGMPVDLLVNDLAVRIDRPLTNRYAHDLAPGPVYVDLDDTLVVRERVNVQLAGFLFQCVNEKRRLVLLTRHRGDLEATLARHRLAGLWDEVIRVRDGEVKADRIVEPDAILIDDSFRERRDAVARLGIKTFDSSMVEMLADHRV